MDRRFLASKVYSTSQMMVPKQCYPDDHFYAVKGSGRVPLSQHRHVRTVSSRTFCLFGNNMVIGSCFALVFHHQFVAVIC